MTETDDAAEDLAHAIRRRIQTRGPLTFAEFMEALSAPAAAVPEMVELSRRPAPWEPGYVAKR